MIRRTFLSMLLAPLCLRAEKKTVFGEILADIDSGKCFRTYSKLAHGKDTVNVVLLSSSKISISIERGLERGKKGRIIHIHVDGNMIALPAEQVETIRLAVWDEVRRQEGRKK